MKKTDTVLAIHRRDFTRFDHRCMRFVFSTGYITLVLLTNGTMYMFLDELYVCVVEGLDTWLNDHVVDVLKIQCL